MLGARRAAEEHRRARSRATDRGEPAPRGSACKRRGRCAPRAHRHRPRPLLRRPSGAHRLRPPPRLRLDAARRAARRRAGACRSNACSIITRTSPRAWPSTGSRDRFSGSPGTAPVSEPTAPSGAARRSSSTAPTSAASAHLRPFRLPGGERAVREPRRSALGLLHDIFGDEAAAQVPDLRAFRRACPRCDARPWCELPCDHGDRDGSSTRWRRSRACAAPRASKGRRRWSSSSPRTARTIPRRPPRHTGCRSGPARQPSPTGSRSCGRCSSIARSGVPPAVMAARFHAALGRPRGGDRGARGAAEHRARGRLLPEPAARADDARAAPRARVCRPSAAALSAERRRALLSAR